jgi:hypothetical protein
MSRLDGRPRLQDFDIKTKANGNEVYILHPGLQVAKLNVESGKITANLLFSKFEQITKIKKIATKIRSINPASDEAAAGILQILMEIDNL